MPIFGSKRIEANRMAETAPDAPTATYDGLFRYLTRSQIDDTARALTYRNTYRKTPRPFPKTAMKYCSRTLPKKNRVSMLKKRCPKSPWTRP